MKSTRGNIRITEIPYVEFHHNLQGIKMYVKVQFGP